jgi:hypothetical protein
MFLLVAFTIGIIWSMIPLVILTITQKGKEMSMIPSSLIALVGLTGRCSHLPDDIKKMLDQAMAGLAVPLVKPKRASIKGPPRTCWQTVAKAAKKQGGKLLAGWSVLDMEPRLPQKSHLARIVLNAHAVLEKNGVWYETVPERYGAIGFIPGLTPTRDACIEFFDDEASMNSVELPAWSFDGLPFTHLAFPVVPGREPAWLK